jgi:sulfite reductase (ferredoxin)
MCGCWLICSYFIKPKINWLSLKKPSKIKNWADAIYLAYAGFVNGAKVIVAENQKQTIKGIIDLFDTVLSKHIKLNYTLKDLVFQINKMNHLKNLQSTFKKQLLFDTIEAFRLKDLKDEK